MGRVSVGIAQIKVIALRLDPLACRELENGSLRASTASDSLN